MHFKRKTPRRQVKNVRSNLRWLGNSKRRLTKRDKQQLTEDTKKPYACLRSRRLHKTTATTDELAITI